jgi:hypothetical protein
MDDNMDAKEQIMGEVERVLSEGGFTGAAAGVAHKVIADRDFDALTDNQLDVFSQYGASLLRLSCELCEVKLDGKQIKDIFATAGEHNMILCDSCAHVRTQNQKL